jgi:signal transduction histidine kinase
VSELVIELADLSELRSVEAHAEATRREHDAARDALRQANEQKDRFLALVSHELRKPLNATCMALQMFSRPDAVQQGATEMIARQVSHQARLIDDLLDVNRIGRGKIELKRLF